MQKLSKQMESYLRYCEFQKKLNYKTLKAYRIDLNQFCSYASASEPLLSKASITAYIQTLHERYKPKSVKRKLACLKAFVNYLEYEEEIENNPFNKMRLEFKEPKTLPKSLSLKIIKRLLSAIHQEYEGAETEYQRRAATRDLAVLELLFATGLRVSELCGILASDINLGEGWVKVQGKGARERIVFFTNPEVVSVLRRYKKLFKTDIQATGWFFVNRLGSKLSEQSVRSMICRYADSAKIEIHITPHMIRHSFATLMLEEDVDTRYIQSILGHSSITTTQIYTHVTLAKQKQIMRKKHPRNKVTI